MDFQTDLEEKKLQQRIVNPAIHSQLPLILKEVVPLRVIGQHGPSSIQIQHSSQLWL